MTSIGQAQLPQWAGSAAGAGWQERAQDFAKRARAALVSPDTAGDLPTTPDAWMHRLADVRVALSDPKATVNEDHLLALVGAQQVEAHLLEGYSRAIAAMVHGTYTQAHGLAQQTAISKLAPLAAAMLGACAAMNQAHDRAAKA